MNITTKTSLMGFLMALSAISVSTPATAATDAVPQLRPQTIEGRLSRLTTAMKERANQLPVSEQLSSEQLVSLAWGNGGGGGAWRNGGGAWRNGWADGGGFANWHNN